MFAVIYIHIHTYIFIYIVFLRDFLSVSKKISSHWVGSGAFRKS